MRALTACAVVWLLASSTSAAQESINYASVSGPGHRSAGRRGPRGQCVLPVRSRPTSSASAVTDDGGRYRFPYLRVGTYELMVQLAGFAEAHRRIIAVGRGRPSRFPFVLSRRRREASVSRQRRGAGARVGAQPDRDDGGRGRGAEPAAQRPATSSTSRCSRPAWRRPTSTARSSSPRRRRCRASGLSVGSQRNLSNSFIVDGLSANDDAAGLSGMPYGVDAVEQFQVVTSGGQAELGRALGGYVNVVTRSGTNQLRGTAYGYFRDDALNAQNALSGTTLPMSQQQYGASVGGPVRQRPHVLLRERRAAEARSVRVRHHHRRQVPPRSTPGWPRWAIAGQPITTGNYDNPVDSVNLLAKVDHAFTRPRSAQRPLQPLRRRVRELPWRRRAERAVRVGGPRQPRPGRLRQQHPDPRRAHRQRDARAVHAQRSAGAARPIRSGRRSSIAGVATFGTLRLQPPGTAEQDGPDRRHHRPAARRARAARRRRLSSTTTTPSRFRARSAAPTRSRRSPTS